LGEKNKMSTTVAPAETSDVSGHIEETSTKKPRVGGETVKLNNGLEMPVLGLGTWKAEDPKELHDAIIEAVENCGYRLLDCASIYGNESLVGDALKEVFERGKVKRSDMFILSKLWNTHHRPEHVRAACENTLKDLKLDYLDCYLIHWPVAFEFNGIPIPTGVPKDDKGYPIFANVSLQETWKAMEGLVEAGLVKSIGVSNYRLVELLDLLTYAKIKPVVNQVECHPYFTRKELLDECRRLGVELMAYSSFGGSDAKKGPLTERAIQRCAKKTQKDICTDYFALVGSA